MCMVSMVGDTWRRDASERWPMINPMPSPYQPNSAIDIASIKADVASIRREMEELRELLKAARKYDAAMGQPDCDNDEKLAMIRKLAEAVGLDPKDF